MIAWPRVVTLGFSFTRRIIMLDLTKSMGNEFTTYSHTKQGEILDWCPTFLPSADHQLLGGIPLSGKVTEIYGKASAGKSTFTMSAIKHLTDANVTVVYLDEEGTTSSARMQSLGIDTNKVFLPKHKVKRDGTCQPFTIEFVQKLIQKVSAISIKQKQPVVFIWDTIAVAPSEAQLKAGADNNTIGTQARAINKLFYNLNADFMTGYPTLIVLNQARDNTNATNPYSAMIPITKGGKGLEHAVSLKLLMNKGSKIKSHGEEIGNQAHLKFMKSKIGGNAGANPANVDVLRAPGMGCDFTYNLYDEARHVGLITGSAWQSYQSLSGKNIKQHSSNNFIKFLRSSKGKPFLYEIWQRLIKYYFPTCYPALFNERITFNSNTYPFLKGMRKYYVKKQLSLPKNERNFNFNNYYSLHQQTVKKLSR